MPNSKPAPTFPKLIRRSCLANGPPCADLGETAKPRIANLDRVSKAVDAYRKTINRACRHDTDRHCDDHALAYFYLIEALSGLKPAPTVPGLRDPSGVFWPYNIVRKDGTIYALFVDPDGGGDFLVPFSEAEIVDLD